MIYHYSILRWYYSFSLSILTYFGLAMGFAALTWSAPARAYHFSVVSYNTGLARHFVPLTDQRYELLKENLKKETADALCLQEVWDPAHQKGLAETLKDVYPFAQMVPGRNRKLTSTPACWLWDIAGVSSDKILNCVAKNCLINKKSGDGLVSCTLNHCRESLDKLKRDRPDCAKALFSQVGKALPKIIANALNPFERASEFAFKGEAGLMILSKHPIVDGGVEDLASMSTTNRRAILRARMAPKGKPIEVDLYCTHLTANLSNTIPYMGGFLNWEEENLMQTKRLLSFVETQREKDFYSTGDKQKDPAKLKTLIAGDFNFGPEIKDKKLHGSFERHYDLMTESGYVDIYEYGALSCSFCPGENSLIRGGSDRKEGSGEFIDHIFAWGLNLPSRFQYERVYTEKYPLPNPQDGKSDTELSDHFGIRATLFW